MTAPTPDIIDLGDIGTPELAPSVRRLPRLGVAPRRWLALGLILATALLGHGSAPEERPPLQPPLWMLQITDRPMLTPDALVARPVNAEHFSAYDRITGRELWSLQLGSQSLISVDQYRRGGPMVASFDQNSSEATSTEILDPTTGRVLASSHGAWAGFAGDGGVVLIQDLQSGGCMAAPGMPPEPDPVPEGVSGVGPTCESVAAYDGRTGARLWGFGGSANAAIQFERDRGEGLIDAVSVTTTEGAFAVYDPVTGDLIWQGSTPPEVVTSLRQQGGSSILTRDRQIVAYHRGSAVVVEAYARGASTPLWSQRLAGADDISGGLSCGGYVCLYTSEQIVFLDGRTGQERMRTGFGPAEFLSPDTLLAITVAGSGQTATVWDLRTGVATGPLPLEAVILWPGGGDRLLGLRRVGSGYTLYLGDAYGRVEALGRLAGSTANPEDSQCSVEGDTLACVDVFNHMRVWRLPVSARVGRSG